MNYNPCLLTTQLLDFELSAEDMRALDALDQGPAARIVDFSFFNGYVYIISEGQVTNMHNFSLLIAHKTYCQEQ